MRKLLYLTLVLGAAGIYSCDDDAGPDGNYGDSSIRPAMELNSFYCKADPSKVYTLTVDPTQPTDTTYIYSYEAKDTVKDANGNPVIGSNGQLQINTHTVEYKGMTAKYVVYEPIEMPALPTVTTAAADTFIMRAVTNSHWSSSVAGGRTGLSMVNGSGAGDSDVSFRITKNTSKSARTRYAYIYTSDSTVMHKLTFIQKGSN
jgi:hypothetical protein